MRSASMPPMRKNMIAAAPYITPTRLWSTDVIQLRQPFDCPGRANTPSACAGVRVPPDGRASGPVESGASMMAMFSSSSRHVRARWVGPERGQIGDQLVDLRVAELEVGHAAALVRRHRHQSDWVSE